MYKYMIDISKDSNNKTSTQVAQIGCDWSPTVIDDISKNKILVINDLL